MFLFPLSTIPFAASICSSTLRNSLLEVPPSCYSLDCLTAPSNARSWEQLYKNCERSGLQNSSELMWASDTNSEVRILFFACSELYDSIWSKRGMKRQSYLHCYKILPLLCSKPFFLPLLSSYSYSWLVVVKTYRRAYKLYSKYPACLQTAASTASLLIHEENSDYLPVFYSSWISSISKMKKKKITLKVKLFFESGRILNTRLLQESN